ncbi:3-hydroxy-3-methylglutaryl coenzyme A reductase mlcD [Trichinella spiralis]|uniref:3-hydroxy-3-methylglutaryl coenzyme A reductase mlcD n=1 Tax=Trichinella spiralis TaxID=6334 RepID=A0ABR3K181_TRISP
MLFFSSFYLFCFFSYLFSVFLEIRRRRRRRRLTLFTFILFKLLLYNLFLPAAVFTHSVRGVFVMAPWRFLCCLLSARYICILMDFLHFYA